MEIIDFWWKKWGMDDITRENITPNGHQIRVSLFFIFHKSFSPNEWGLKFIIHFKDFGGLEILLII